MRIWPIFKKEMRLYFTSPIAYVVAAIFALIAGYFFSSIFAYFTLASMQSMMNPAMARELNVTDSVMRPLFSNISVILLLLMPLVTRSEEHTSELQSLTNLVCRLLLEKKKKTNNTNNKHMKLT